MKSVALIFGLGMLLPSGANAFCYLGSSYPGDLASQVADRFEYLICEHNSLVDAVNDLVATVQRQTYLLDEKAATIGDLEWQVRTQQGSIEALSARIADLEDLLDG